MLIRWKVYCCFCCEWWGRIKLTSSLPSVGVHTSCPIELSPLSVVVRYGDPVAINCSTQEVELEGIGWEASQGGQPLQSATHLTWTVENLTEWTISPLCFINPTQDSKFEQCMRSPNVVIYSKLACLARTDLILCPCLKISLFHKVSLRKSAWAGMPLMV